VSNELNIIGPGGLSISVTTVGQEEEEEEGVSDVRSLYLSGEGVVRVSGS
jgi:hypothetical protein